VGDALRGFGDSVGDGARIIGGCIEGFSIGRGLSDGRISVKFLGFEDSVRLVASGAEFTRLW
jgi:hypothetical protein